MRHFELDLMVPESDFLDPDSLHSSCPPHSKPILFLLESLFWLLCRGLVPAKLPLSPPVSPTIFPFFAGIRISFKEDVSLVPGCFSFFPLQIWMSQACPCREDPGHSGVSLKDTAFKKRWIVPSCAMYWKPDCFHICHCLLSTGFLQTLKTASCIFMPSWEPEGFWVVLSHLKHLVMGCSLFLINEVSSYGGSHHTCLGCSWVNSVRIVYLNEIIHLEWL